MSILDDLKAAIAHPITWLSTITGTFLHAFGMDPMAAWNLIAGTSTYWFGFSSVFAFRFAPSIDFIPESAVQQLYIGVVALYLLVLAYKGFKKIRQTTS